MKYYVKSAGFEKIITGNNPTEACVNAVKKMLAAGEPITTDHFFHVDERGFREVTLDGRGNGDEKTVRIPSVFIYNKVKDERNI